MFFFSKNCWIYPAVVAWGWAGGLITDFTLCRWIESCLGRQQQYHVVPMGLGWVGLVIWSLLTWNLKISSPPLCHLSYRASFIAPNMHHRLLSNSANITMELCAYIRKKTKSWICFNLKEAVIRPWWPSGSVWPAQTSTQWGRQCPPLGSPAGLKVRKRW